jgi:hypothetical protein
MSAPALGRAARAAALGGTGVLALLVAAVAGATPAAAHAVGGGELPAPPWLLSYLGAIALAATAVALRATWSRPRLHGFVGPAAVVASPGPIAPASGMPSADRRPLGLHPGYAVGLILLILAEVAAIVGPDSGAANVAPVAVLVVWWVGLPIVCLVAGDVMRAVNPFVALVALLDRRRDHPAPAAPAWTPAAFLGAFAWFFVAYHRPGSPRALAVFLAVYVVAAVAAGLRWGREWLATGEGFGALSASVALLSPWRRGGTPPPGVASLMVVWIGGTAFDAFASTPFWVDVLGTSQGWPRTMLNTVGLVWIIAIVAGVYLLALRLAERIALGRDDGEGEIRARPALATTLGVALVPLALGWFLAHDLTLLLFEGQNFLALVSDPIGEGWDLFGTVNQTIDYGIVQATWVRWTQVGLLAAGHVAFLVIAHDTALAVVRPRAAMRLTWALTAAAIVSIVAGALMVLG